MARKIVDIGVSGNDGTGDSIREAFRKTNENFQELYAVFGQGGFLKFTDLSDTPDTLIGQGNKLPVVNAIGTGLIFKDFFSPNGTIQFDYSEPETFDIVSVQRASGIATITLSENHNLDPGQKITVASTDNTSFNTSSATLLSGTTGSTLVYNNAGTDLSTSSAAGTISSYGSIKIDTLSSKLEDDPLPKLSYSLNASSQLIGGLRSPINNTEFQTAVNNFNTNHGTAFGIDSFAINKGYADAKYVNITGDTMTGHLNVPANASGNEAPRASEVVLKTGGDMTGILNLADHPGGLSGSGTPNGVDDLQAATKYYVDSSSYNSRYNIYVTPGGDDSQARTPRGQEGRSKSYAYASINKACQKAEQLINDAPWETGPYRQLIAYGDGDAFSEVTQITTGASGTTRIYFTNNGGSRVDQGRLPKPDIVPGKIVVGRNSGAQGFIYQYYGSDGSSTVGEDYFDLQDVIGTFEIGENLEYDQAVKNIQISVMVESGIYYEDYPIRIPANTAIVGDELRRVMVRPADRPSRSPWVDIWFRRDLTFDGLTLTSTEYGYHYLTDPSDILSEPKNNRDIDVFLCNDAVIIRQITCQGHGGFMMVLDPEGQILTKSAYCQQSGSFAGSLNKQRFAGGQYVDGFAGNVSMKIQEKLSDTEFLVTGSERAPTTPCSFVIDGRIFKIEAYTDDGNGYGSARQLIRRNIDFIKAEVIGYINTELSPPFQFNETKCARDVGLIVDALGYDLALGTNFNGVRAGQSYYRGTQYSILPDQRDEYLDALVYTRSLISDTLSGNSVARTRAETSFDEIADIIENGVTASDTITWGIPSGTPVGRINSKDLLLDNLDFIKEETIAWIAEEYPDFVYDEDKCRRDTAYIINSVIYDVLYEGNSATVEAGLQYYDGNGSLQIPGQTLQTTEVISYASSIAQLIVRNTPVPFPKQTAVEQVFDELNPGTTTEASRIGVLMGYINTIILGGRTAAPTIEYPSLTGVLGSLTDSRTLLLSNKESIKSDTLVYLRQRYSYNQEVCARDTGYICEAIAHDIYYSGNLKTVQAGLAYFNSSASSKIVIDQQLTNTLAAINYINTLIINVINNEDPDVRYQQSVLQFIDTSVTDGGLATSTINGLFDEFIGILENPPSSRDARALLVENKAFITAEVINYINNKYASFTYDDATCRRDVGYVVDAIGYDLMFGSNFQTIICARRYYSAASSVAIGVQKAATIDAFTFLKDELLALVTGNATATTSITDNMDMFLDIITNGLSQEPDFVIPDPTSYDVNFNRARTLIEANRTFIKAEIIQYITNNYPGLTYDPAVCQRDTGYLLDALFYDLTYGGNLQSVIAGEAYYSYTTLQVATGEKAATLAAYGYLKSLVEDIALDLPITALQVGVAQVRGTPGNSSASATAGQRIDNIIDIVDTGLGTIALTTPSTSWVSAGLVTARGSLNTNKATLQTAVTNYIDSNYTNTLVYNEDTCARDVGFIVAAVSSDLLYGGTYLTIRAAQRYYIGTASTRVVLENQLAQTIDSFAYAKEVAQAVLNQVPPTLNYQEINSVPTVDRVDQVFSSDYDGSAFVLRAGQLFDLLNEVITDPEVDVSTVLTGAAPIVYPTYRLVLSNTTPVTNDLDYTISGYVSRADSGVGDGSYDVVFNIVTAPDAPLTKTRYRIFGNSNANYNNDAVECVASTTSQMTLRYPSDPGVFGSGTTTIEYVKDFMLLSAGNTSMCSNDFTQINDLGYGLVATNIGLIETVSVFSYYCWTAYYANNGGQIRSLNGSNAHGEFGIISAGSDPLEVPDKCNLSDNMMQVARVFKQDIYSTDSAKDDLAVYFYQHDYAPYNVSEVEINHGAGVITDLDNTSIVGGSLYTNGTYINVPLTGGTGSGATANIVISGGAVTTVALVAAGIRYTVGDLLSVSAASVGGTGSGFSIAVDTVIGNGIARYEVASVTDVSNTIPSTISGTPVKTGPTGGKYYVTYSFSALPYTPRLDVYTVSGATTIGFNGTKQATASTTTSVTLEYSSDPGTWAGGSATIWGRGNILRLNINTGGNNDTAANGLAVDLEHDQKIIVRSNQNFKFYEVDDTNPTRPSTALTFVGDPDPDAIVYRVLAYSSKGPLSEDLAEDEAILGFDTTYDYIKVLVNADNVANVDPVDGSKTLGSTIGDVRIAVDRINEVDVEDRLNTGDMILAWDGKIHKVLSYEDLGLAAGYGIIEIEDVTAKCLSGSTAEGLNTSVDPTYNLDISEPPTLRCGLASTEPAEVIVRISTCRVTGHDFLDIGTGSYNDTNFPSKIYGAPKEPNQAREVTERTRGRCFYVTTDQDGIFRVGRFFTVDQGTGRVTFAASIALSNLDGLGFKRGVTVSEFSNDDRFVDGANDALPTEAAVQGYIDRRLGMDRNNAAIDSSQLIGPGYLDRAGLLTFTGPDPLDMGGFVIANLSSPTADTDAANKLYVRTQELSDDRVDTTTSPSRSLNDLLVFNGVKWINAETVTVGDIKVELNIGTKNLALNIKDGTIINTDVNASAAIAQSKLAMNAATTRSSATGIAQADRGLASFKDTEFNITNGWVEFRDSTSTATGINKTKIQYIANDTFLGNLTGSSTYPREVTSGSIVTAGDGIKNASFAPGSVGTNGRALIMTSTTPNVYSTVNISTSGQASSLVQSDGSGVVDVQQLEIDGYKTLDTSGTNLQMFTPGAVNFLTATGASAGATTITLVGTTNANALSTASTTTFSPANATVTLSPTGSGTVTIAPASVGSMNNVNIGATTRGTGAFTTLGANSTTSFSGDITITSGTNLWNKNNPAIANGSYSAGSNHFELRTTDGSNPAIGFHRSGYTAVTLYHSANNNLRLRDANTGNDSLIWHSTNDGSGSGLDADLLDGLELHTGRNNEANKVVRTDGSGYLQTGYINSSSGDENNASNPGRIWGTNGSDSYLRTYRNANVQVGYSSYAAEAWNNTFYVRGTSPTIQMVDTDNVESRYVHTNSGYIGFLGNTGGWVLRCDNTYTYATATQALYADLAENYAGDADYEPGTVLVFGGEQEVTISTIHNDTRIAGVVSTKPAHLMNGELEVEHKIPVALQGRVPCKVIGKVKKGDMMVASAKPGYAVVNNSPAPGTIIGKALENKDSLDEGVIEVVVGRV